MSSTDQDAYSSFKSYQLGSIKWVHGVGTSSCILKKVRISPKGWSWLKIIYYHKTNLFTLYFLITFLIRISLCDGDFVLLRFYHFFIGRQVKYKTKSWQIFQIHVLRFFNHQTLQIS